jgi:zinc transporter ZupT
MVRIFLALAALVGLMWLASWLGKASPEQRVRAIKLILLYGVAGALLVLVVTGRIPWMLGRQRAKHQTWKPLSFA